MSGCEGYHAIASVYDGLNQELNYEKWADFFEQCFDRFLKKKPTLVLDLACGTGRMTRTLARRGYDMIGVDGSEDMLSEAYAASEGEPILYLRQDMRSFELYGTVGAVVCCLDSLNYLLEESDVKKVFSLVHNYLDPDGIFLFDVNSPYKFKHVYGDNAYVLEDEREEDGEARAVYCGWQNAYDEESGICDFYLSLFEEVDEDTYRRSDEHQRERCYSSDCLKSLLESCGFAILGIWGDDGFGEVTDTSERLYFAARAKK